MVGSFTGCFWSPAGGWGLLDDDAVAGAKVRHHGPHLGQGDADASCCGAASCDVEEDAGPATGYLRIGCSVEVDDDGERVL